MKIGDFLTELLKFKNSGVKEISIDKELSKVCDIYGFIDLRDNEGKVIKKIRIIRKQGDKMGQNKA